MKYIITKSQQKLLKESNEEIWLKRRISKNKMDALIAHNIDEFYDLCDRFDNKEEFSNEVINVSVSDYSYELGTDWDNEEEIEYLLTQYFHQLYFDKLCDLFVESCENEDDEDDEDDDEY